MDFLRSLRRKRQRSADDAMLSHARVHELQCAVVNKAFDGACSDHVVHTREGGSVHLTFFMPSASLVAIAALQRVKGVFVDDDGLCTVDVGWSAAKKTLKVTCALGVAPRVKRRLCSGRNTELTPTTFPDDVPASTVRRLHDVERRFVAYLATIGYVADGVARAEDVVQHRRCGKAYYLTSAYCKSVARFDEARLTKLGNHPYVDDVWVGWDEAKGALVLTTSHRQDRVGEGTDGASAVATS